MMKFILFQANWASVILRFYLVMGIVIAAGFTGQWAFGLLALPTFLLALLGVRIDFPKKHESTVSKTQIKIHNTKAA